MARESTEARITSRMASNGVLCAIERLLPRRTMINVARKTVIPAKGDLNKRQIFRLQAQTE
jgi:hypothetical protein